VQPDGDVHGPGDQVSPTLKVAKSAQKPRRSKQFPKLPPSLSRLIARLPHMLTNALRMTCQTLRKIRTSCTPWLPKNSSRRDGHGIDRRSDCVSPVLAQSCRFRLSALCRYRVVSGLRASRTQPKAKSSPLAAAQAIGAGEAWFTAAIHTDVTELSDDAWPSLRITRDYPYSPTCAGA
jgi:hypothetical protein